MTDDHCRPKCPFLGCSGCKYQGGEMGSAATESARWVSAALPTMEADTRTESSGATHA